jgi:hypothetical protein
MVLVAGLISLIKRNYKPALVLGGAAAVLGVTTWGLFRFQHNQHQLNNLLVGYYLWRASLVVLPAGALLIGFWEPAS